jgi:sialidase-1
MLFVSACHAAVGPKVFDALATRGVRFDHADCQPAIHRAVAMVEGAGIMLSSDEFADPVAAVFEWQDNLDWNSIAGSPPVSPFRRDTSETLVATKRPASGFTGFESAKSGTITTATFDGATWTAMDGQAEIMSKLARTGGKCLHLLGGQHSQIDFVLSAEHAPKAYDRLTFAAERWTRRDPFTFRVAASTADGVWKEIYNGDNEIKVGRGYLNNVSIPVPKGATRFRLICTSPPNTGILIDDMNLVEAKPMSIVGINVSREVAPVLIGQHDSPLLSVIVQTEGGLSAKKLTGIEVELIDGLAEIVEIGLGAQRIKPSQTVSLNTDIELVPGKNVVPITCELAPAADIDRFIKLRLRSITLDGDQRLTCDEQQIVKRKIGVALRQRGQDGVHTYRIPGITTTNAGTLIAVYDNRNRAGGDLPGDIDVGMSRSTDGGQTWSPMRVIMDLGNDPQWNYDGVGDPSILTDRKTGTTWVAGTWSHGNRSWRGSGPGMTPEETGQLMLVNSSDDGLTWSKPVNITSQVKKNRDWRFVLQGPGNGITLADGTLVFPAQYRGVDDPAVGGKPFSTIIYSQDHGEMWQIGSGVKIDTTEAQIVQLADKSIMINCRDNRGGSRSVYTTADLGQTWQEHPTSRQALPEPVCNADLLRVEHPKHGPLLFFSNPNTTRGRQDFTIKVSADEGMTWPNKWHTLYDQRPGSGYSTLTSIGDDRIGVLYEGPGELYFLRFAIDDLVSDQ